MRLRLNIEAEFYSLSTESFIVHVLKISAECDVFHSDEILNASSEMTSRIINTFTKQIQLHVKSLLACLGPGLGIKPRKGVGGLVPKSLPNEAPSVVVLFVDNLSEMERT